LSFYRTAVETFDADGLTAKRSENEENVNIGIDDAEEVVSWYAGFLKALERRNANSYDAVIRKALGKEGDTSAVARAVRTLLGVAGSAVALSGTDLFERIHHPNAAVRVAAVKHLVENYNCVQERDRDLTGTAVTARLRDDNATVSMFYSSFLICTGFRVVAWMEAPAVGVNGAIAQLGFYTVVVFNIPEE
jgi:hypothetical protein